MPLMRCAPELAQIAPILDLFVEDSQLNVYAGQLEVRPPVGRMEGCSLGNPWATRRE